MNIVRPRKVNFEKTFRSKRFKNYSNASLVFGDKGIKTLNLLILNSRQLNRFLILTKRYVRKFSKTYKKFWLLYSYSFCYTKKPKGSRMGKGKGKSTVWAFKITSGNYFMEFKNLRYGKVLLILSFFRSLLNSKLVVK